MGLPVLTIWFGCLVIYIQVYYHPQWLELENITKYYVTTVDPESECLTNYRLWVEKCKTRIQKFYAAAMLSCTYNYLSKNKQLPKMNCQRANNSLKLFVKEKTTPYNYLAKSKQLQVSLLTWLQSDRGEWRLRCSPQSHRVKPWAEDTVSLPYPSSYHC